MLCVSFWRPRTTELMQFLDDNLQNHQSFYRQSIISTNNWQNQIENLILLSSEKLNGLVVRLLKTKVK